MQSEISTTWTAQGLLFENCSCQLICPAHISFKQHCTYERCRGHWCFRFEDGQYGASSLVGLNTVVVFDSPQRMYDGDWLEAIYIDERADDAQRQAIENIFKGRAGGPWEVLARFVETWLPTRFVPIQFVDSGREKRMWIDNLFETSVKSLRAKDDGGLVTLENLFNQIHGETHVLARGKTRCRDGAIEINNDGTHGLYSHFSWTGERGAA